LPAFPTIEKEITASLLEEGRIEVGAVDGDVAQRASLKEAGLVMKRRSPWRGAEGRSRVALQTEQVDVAQLQHVRIRSTVRQMARLASIDLYGRMLVYKRSLLVRVTRKANCVLRGGSPHLLWTDRAMDVVAVAALDQPFVHSMMEGHVELGFLLEMAGVAKLGLGLYEQELRFVSVVRRMAGDATDVTLGMLRVDCIDVLRAAGMTGEAAFVDFLGGVIFKDENLANVPTTLDVSGTGTVASLASLV